MSLVAFQVKRTFSQTIASVGDLVTVTWTITAQNALIIGEGITDYLLNNFMDNLGGPFFLLSTAFQGFAFTPSGAYLL